MATAYQMLFIYNLWEEFRRLTNLTRPGHRRRRRRRCPSQTLFSYDKQTLMFSIIRYQQHARSIAVLVPDKTSYLFKHSCFQLPSPWSFDEYQMLLDCSAGSDKNHLLPLLLLLVGLVAVATSSARKTMDHH